MAYVERYFKTIVRDGHTIRLSIQERVRAVSGSSAPKEIGDFNSLQLHIQGQQANLETPIVKTSVTFSMFDTIDKEDTEHVKYGGWETFYTPDQTLWLVEIRKDGVLMWSGYITPDSWEDDLVYRGLITITARDMIGHMTDFEVKESDFVNIATRGMASIADIIQEGLYAAQVPMSLAIHSSAPWLTYQGTKLYDWGLDITSLLGKNWYQAIEGILDSFGLTLRYSGRNTVILAPIRNIPLCGYASARETVYTPQFLHRSGHRELVPAYKQVVETLNYDAHADVIETFPEEVFVFGFHKEGWEEVTLNGGRWTAGTGLGVIRQNTATNAFNDVVGDASRYFLLRHQSLTASSQNGLRRTVLMAPSVSVNVQMKLAHTYTFRGDVVTPYEKMVEGRAWVYLEWLKTDGSSLWLDESTGAWVEGMVQYMAVPHQTSDYEKNVNFDIVTPDVPGQLRVYFFEGSTNTSVVRYTRVGDFCVSANADSIPLKIDVNTTYDMSQNTTLNRQPVFGVVPEWIKTAGAISNGVYLMDEDELFPPIRNVQWNGSGSSLPVPVFVHMQHLAMHAKANNILTGVVRELDGSLPNVDTLWRIYDRTFVLVSGDIDFNTGYVNGAVLVEFDAYELVWSGMSVDYKSNSGEYRRPNGGGASSSSSSSGEGGGQPYVLPKATETSLGGVAVGYFPQGANLTIEIDAAGNIYAPLTAAAITSALGYTPGTGSGSGGTNPYVLPVATSTALGGIKTGYTATGANLPVKLSNQKAYVQVTREAIVQALGFTPADEQDIPGTSPAPVAQEDIDRTAPKLRILKGESYNGTEYEVLSVDHPDIGKTGAELVLMVFNNRTGARRKRSASDWYRRTSKKWSVAMGEDGARQLVLSPSIKLNRVRDYLVQEYLCDGMTSRPNMRRWDYQDWMDRTSPGNIGFGMGSFSNGWMGKKQKRFGVALRVPNPQFEARAGISIHTQAGPDQHGEIQPRYLYSEVMPLTVQIDIDKAIRFSLIEP